MSEFGAPILSKEIFQTGIPILGICYGLQEIAWHHGKNVVAGTEREYGHADVQAKRHNVYYQRHLFEWPR